VTQNPKTSAVRTTTWTPPKVRTWPASLKLPAAVHWGVLFLLPLGASGYWLFTRLAALPAESWQLTVYPMALLGAVLLVPVNWGLESLKWAELLPWARMARRTREVLYGTAWSLIGPFRLGAAVGRIAAVRKEERNMAIRAFSTACVSQWWCTITAAAIGLMCAGYWAAGLSVALISGITLALYFGWTPTFWKAIKHSPLCGHWGLSRKIATVRRRRALTLSVARFFVIISQFVLLLNAFGHLAGWTHYIDRFFEQGQGVALTWGLTSLAPMPAFGDLGLREAAALLTIATPTSADVTAVVAATLTLWVINLFIPSIVGLVWHWNAQRRANAFRANFRA
jgi:hypothetical protein